MVKHESIFMILFNKFAIGYIIDITSPPGNFMVYLLIQVFYF